MDRHEWFRVFNFLLVFLLVMTAIFAFWNRGSVAQLSLQLQRKESEAVPPQENEVESGSFIRFHQTLGGFGIVSGYFDDPMDLTVDEDGNLYVLDSGNNRVQRFDKNLSFALEFGDKGNDQGEFKDPTAIAVDKAGFIYVVDTGNHRVQKFDHDGHLLIEWGSLGSSEGRFKRPRDITFDDENNVYVADTGNDRIQKFTSGGVFIEEWSRFGVRRDKGASFNDIISLAYDDDRFGFILTLSDKKGLIQRFELNGDLWDSILITKPENSHPVRIEVDNRRQYIYLADDKGKRILRYTKDGSYDGMVSEADEPFSEPRGIFVDSPKKNLYVADIGTDKVFVLSIR